MVNLYSSLLQFIKKDLNSIPNPSPVLQTNMLKALKDVHVQAHPPLFRKNLLWSESTCTEVFFFPWTKLSTDWLTGWQNFLCCPLEINRFSLILLNYRHKKSPSPLTFTPSIQHDSLHLLWGRKRGKRIFTLAGFCAEGDVWHRHPVLNKDQLLHCTQFASHQL